MATRGLSRVSLNQSVAAARRDMEHVRLIQSMVRQPLMYPSLLRRYLATVADAVFVFALIYVYAQTPLPKTALGASAWWPLLLLMFYEPVCNRAGSTVGQLLMGFRVRTFKGGQKVPIWRGVLRLFSKYLLGAISFIKMPVHKQRRALHDIISGTIVIEAKSKQESRSRTA